MVVWFNVVLDSFLVNSYERCVLAQRLSHSGPKTFFFKAIISKKLDSDKSNCSLHHQVQMITFWAFKVKGQGQWHVRMPFFGGVISPGWIDIQKSDWTHLAQSTAGKLYGFQGQR